VQIPGPSEGSPAFPRAALLVPPLVPVVVVVTMVLSGAFGPRGGGIHSTVGAFLSLALWLSALGAAIFAVGATRRATALLAQRPSLRSGANIACLGVAVTYLLAIAVWLVIGILF
jgi:hypothetical protein